MHDRSVSRKLLGSTVSASLSSLSKPLGEVDLPTLPLSLASTALDPFVVETPSAFTKERDNQWVSAHELSDFLLAPSSPLAPASVEETEELLYAAREFFSPLSPDVEASLPPSFSIDDAAIADEQFFAFSGAPFVDSIGEHAPSLALAPPIDKKSPLLTRSCNRSALRKGPRRE